MTWKPDVIIYHDNCNDGFACAWLARLKWPEIDKLPAQYGLPVPAYDYAGKNVLIADFSYKPSQLCELIDSLKAASVVILDHHKTAEANLAQFSIETCGSALFTISTIDGILYDMKELGRMPIIAHFNMKKSGARLTCEFIHGDKDLDPPLMIELIEDRDLWKFDDPRTRQFHMYLSSFPRKHESWSTVNSILEFDPDRIFSMAGAIERWHDNLIAAIVKTAVVRKFADFDSVAVAYAPYDLVSELGSALLRAYPDVAFAAIGVDAYGGRTWSLRSTDDRTDVSDVAKRYGGGGHRNAAGFRVPI